MRFPRRLRAGLAALFAVAAAFGPVAAVAQVIPGVGAGVAVFGPAPCPGAATLSLDFARGVYCFRGQRSASFLALPGASFSRTGQELAQDASGAWRAFASGVPAITNAGFSSWPSRTNKSTNYNAAPTDLTNVTKTGDAAATLTVVNDAAALRAAGFGPLLDAGVMNGNVFRLDNSAGAASAYAVFSGATGNTNTHIISAFVRGGSGGVMANGGQGNAAFGASGVYLRRLSNTLTPAAGSLAAVYASAGQIVYFILNQLEEAANVSPPIIVAGASATRGTGQLLITGLTIPNPHTMFAEWVKQGDDGASFARIASLEDGSTGVHQIYHRHTNHFVRGVVSGTVDHDIGVAALGTVQRAAYRFQTDNTNGRLNNTALYAADDTTATLYTVDRLYLGRSSALNQLSGFVRRVVIYPVGMSNTEMLGLTQ